MIHQPFWNYQQKDDNNLGRTFHGVVGCGYGGKLNPSDAPKGQRIVTSTRSHSTGLIKSQNVKIVVKVKDEKDELIRDTKLLTKMVQNAYRRL